MFRRRPTALAVASAAITAALVFAGCTGSGDDQDAAPVGSGVTSSVVTADPPAGTSTEGPSDAAVTATDAPQTDPQTSDAPTASTTATVPSATPSDPAVVTTDPSVSSSDPTTPPTAVPAALDFSATLLDGSEIEMGEYAGRPVLLWFWAPW